MSKTKRVMTRLPLKHTTPAKLRVQKSLMVQAKARMDEIRQALHLDGGSPGSLKEGTGLALGIQHRCQRCNTLRLQSTMWRSSCMSQPYNSCVC